MKFIYNKRFTLLGCGISNLYLANYLSKYTDKIFISEQQDEQKVKSYIQQLSPKVKYECGGHTEKTLNCDILIRSPGIPLQHHIIKQAINNGITVTTELEVAYQILLEKLSCEPIIIAITGTNGKTTTTDLTGKICASYKKTVVCGNIGEPLIKFVDEIDKDTIVVVETSSYQLEDIIKFKPKIACLLNITEDHLEHHGSMQNYINAKLRIFENQTKDDYAVVNYDNEITRQVYHDIKIQNKILFSRTTDTAVHCWLNKNMYVNFRFNTVEEKLKVNTTLPGEHNLENILAAISCSLLIGIPKNNIEKIISDYRGVEHRIEFVRNINGVVYINDSKSTNVSSTIVALKSFSNPIHLILGGRDKGAPYTPLIPYIKQKVKSLLLIGEATEIIYEQLKSTNVEIYKCGTLENAVKKAKDIAKSGDVVLLSPACSSFDQFVNFEHRGREFKRIVNNL